MGIKWKNLGNMIENKINGMKLDLKQKRCQYITKNNEIMQEFHSSHPDALLKLNQIHNTHFTGSPLWKLFTEDATRMESTWNKSVKLMMDLPLSTHRRLIEPLSGYTHISTVLIKRFLSFVSQIRKSGKTVTKQLLENMKNDVRSTTGHNLRKILLNTNKISVEELNISDYTFVRYHPLSKEEGWKVILIKELFDLRVGNLEVDNLSSEETEEIISLVCTS